MSTHPSLNVVPTYTRDDLVREARDRLDAVGPLAAMESLGRQMGGQFTDDEIAAALDHVRAYPTALPIAELPPAEPVVFAVDRWATARELVLIVGDDGSGKSTVLAAVLGAMAGAAPAFDRLAVKAGPVLLVSDEDSADVVANHTESIARAHRWDVDLVRSRFHILALAGVQLDQPEWRDHIISEVKRIGAVAVGLDPYADLTNAKENDNDEARPFKRFLRDIGKAGATPFVVHHAGKAAEGKRKRDRVRGASALLAASRSAWWIEPCDLGIAVECLKLSRAERPDPFVVSREIEADPDNPGNWHTARLAYVSNREAEEDTAERFILDTLERYPFTKSTEIRELAKGTGLNGPEVSAALKRLELLKRVAFQAGSRNAKHWYRPDVTSLPENSGQAGQATLPSLSEPARQVRGGTDEPAPLDREGRVGKVADRLGQVETADHECARGCGQPVGSRGVTCAACQFGGKP